MIKILDQPASNAIMSIAITGISNTDWLRVIDAWEAKLMQFDKICWYLEMEDFRQDSQIDLLPYTVFEQTKRNRFDRIALVADPVWHGPINDLIQPLAGVATGGRQIHVTFFSIKDQQQAHQWILEGTRFK